MKPFAKWHSGCYPDPHENESSESRRPGSPESDAKCSILCFRGLFHRVWSECRRGKRGERRRAIAGWEVW